MALGFHFDDVEEAYFRDKLGYNIPQEQDKSPSISCNIPRRPVKLSANNTDRICNTYNKEYIEREELNKTFDNVCSNEVLRKQIRQYIDSVPSVDVRQVVHAHWTISIDDFDDGFGERKYQFCSNCNTGVYKHDAKKYCPNCGAIMDGK